MSREKNSTLTICQLVVGHGENLGVRCSFMISQNDQMTFERTLRNLSEGADFEPA